MSLRTPLATAKGSGSAKEGTGHFWHQRLTAIALIPLVIWFCFSLASLPTLDYSSIRQWLASPVSAVLMISAVIAMFYHAALGLQVVIEDYVSDRGIRAAGIIAVNLLCALLAITGVFSVIKIALGS
ncbi:MAG: succinate dehydrogenase, hydrophobic membrane anchor protein [Gammaproteobacteria bacterium]|nr:succinate dehydrogenase, hydrophobic membrane anchor protein [Gammaproteobacteria bacterium]